MGCNTHIWLPTDVDGHNAADVIGILAGLPSRLAQFERSTGTYTEVDGASEEVAGCAGMSNIVLKPQKGKKLVDGDDVHSCYFHYGARRNGKIWNLLSPTSTPFWCAVANELVNWFGGIVEYNDCGSGKRNEYRARRLCPVDKYGLIPDDGKAWDQYHAELLKVRPVTSLAIRRARKVAAYASHFEKDGITEKATG